jgi:hypothetical protein
MLIVVSLLTCATAWLPAQYLKSEESPLDLVPFALPGTPWMPIVTNATDSNGTSMFILPTTSSEGYYRARLVP